MRNLTLDIKLLENGEDLDNLKKEDLAFVNLRYGSEHKTAYKGLAICAQTDKNFVSFVEMESSIHPLFIKFHILRKDTLGIVSNAIFNMNDKAYEILEMDKSYNAYQSALDLLRRVIK